MATSYPNTADDLIPILELYIAKIRAYKEFQDWANEQEISLIDGPELPKNIGIPVTETGHDSISLEKNSYGWSTPWSGYNLYSTQRGTAQTLIWKTDTTILVINFHDRLWVDSSNIYCREMLFEIGNDRRQPEVIELLAKLGIRARKR